MGNFLRALKFAWPYRFRFAFSVICAMAVAGFWGANLSAIYPIVRVFVEGDNLQGWIDGVVNENSDKLEDHQAEKLRLEQQLASATTGGSDEIASQLKSTDYRIWQGSIKARWYGRLQRFIYSYFPTDARNTLVMIMAILLSGLALKGCFSFLNESTVGSVTQMAMYDLKNKLYSHCLKMDLNTFHQQGSSELMARFTNDLETVANGTNTLLGKMIREPLKAMACLLLACWLNWRLTLVVLALVPVAVVLMGTIGRYMRRATRRSLESMASIYRILQESFQSIKVVKAFTLEPQLENRFRDETRGYYKKSMRIIKLEALTSPAMEMIGVCAIVSSLLIGAFLVIGKTEYVGPIRMSSGIMDLPALALLYAFLAGISDPARKMSNVYGRVQRASAAADRIFDFLNREAKITNSPSATKAERHSKSIEFDDVCFHYPGSKAGIDDINLRIQHGECIAIVGHNGCGKSTLVSLLTRFYDPDAGTVELDGIDIKDLDLRSLRNQIGVVTQETLLFNDSVTNNIKFGNPDASETDIFRAAQQAYVHRFAETLPDGYDTILGEQAVKLSGGQRQRIALARAILRDPAIMILDEATSALDLESESLIHKALQSFLKDRTSFLITHRLSTLSLADRIMVMDSGRLVDIATHDELMSRCELYRRLREYHSSSKLSA